MLRCFPHCCPGHRPRSYCGAPIHVEVAQSTGGSEDSSERSGKSRSHSGTSSGTGSARSSTPDELLDSSQLLVYGHFEREEGEEEDRPDFAEGEQVRLRDIIGDGSSWVRGVALEPPASDHVRIFACHLLLFELVGGECLLVDRLTVVEHREHPLFASLQLWHVLTGVTHRCDTSIPVGISPSSLQEDAERRKRIFTFNDDEYCHWLYDWNSGTSQRERARLHFFRVYVFKPSSSDHRSRRSSHSSPTPRNRASSNSSDGRSDRQEVWEVASVVSSPGFTISAFRKEASTPSTGDAISETQSPLRQPQPLNNLQAEMQFSPVPSRSLPPPPLQVDRPRFSEEHRVQMQEMHRLTQRNPEVVTKSTKLTLIALVLAQLDMHWIDSKLITNSLFALLRQWSDSSGWTSGASSPRFRENAIWHYVNFVVPKIVGLMRTVAGETSDDARFEEQMMRTRYGSLRASRFQRLAELSEIGLLLLTFELEEAQWGALRRSLLGEASNANEYQDGEARAVNVLALVYDAIEAQIDAFLTKRGVTLDSLTDDLASVVLVDRNRHELFPSALDRHIMTLLRNESLLGLDVFCAQFRELQYATGPQMSGRGYSRSAKTPVATSLNGQWICRAIDIDRADPRPIRPNFAQEVEDPHTRERVRLGLTMIVLLLAVGLKVEVKKSAGRSRSRDEMVDDDAMSQDENQRDDHRDTYSVELRALMSFFPEVGEDLELDGALHQLAALPNGLATEWLGVSVFPFDEGVLDYGGHLQSPAPRRDHIGNDTGPELFTAFYYYGSDGTAWRFRIALGEAPSRGPSFPGSSRLRVRIQIAVGFTDRSGDATSTPGADHAYWQRYTPQQRFDQVRTWEMVAEATLLYDRLPTVARNAARQDEDEPMKGSSEASSTSPRRQQQQPGKGYALV